MNTNALPAGYELLPAELLAHQKELDDLVAKTRKTRASVDDLAAQLLSLDAEVQELTAKLAVRDADRCVAEDADVKRLDAEVRKLDETLDSKQRTLSRTTNALIIQEARCPELDDQVQAAVRLLQQDLICYGDAVLDQLRAVLLEKIKPVRAVFAALTAVSVATGAQSVRDAVAAAFVPDLRAVNVDLRIYSGTNLLAEPAGPEHAALADGLTAALAPIQASLIAAKALGTYVPLASRPKPYVHKGYTTGGAKEDQRLFGAAPAAAPEPAETIEESSNESPLARARRALVHRLA